MIYIMGGRQSGRTTALLRQVSKDQEDRTYGLSIIVTPFAQRGDYVVKQILQDFMSKHPQHLIDPQRTMVMAPSHLASRGHAFEPGTWVYIDDAPEVAATGRHAGVWEGIVKLTAPAGAEVRAVVGEAIGPLVVVDTEEML